MLYEKNCNIIFDAGYDLVIEDGNACIAGNGTATTEAGLKALCTEGLRNYNVYFYHEN